MPKRGTWHNRDNSISLYLPCRTAVILIAVENITDEIQEKGQIRVPEVRQAPAAVIEEVK